MWNCPIQNMFNFLSKRWMLLILKSINEWKNSFGDIKRWLWSISARILSERLSELQYEWYIERLIINEKPIKIQYNITEKWKSLWECLFSLDNWVKENINLS
ncbi:MAG: HxlR family transcriptional regulator [uncultured bacterium (gcode 4)]|uniref:HxlR family transcriptional regulator n=1 Tax=uncultured bacterium (gcode 4) TaxID=1234023 RepID=K2GSR2_9BACT|nr:MAG: HxlR family transcriptional regulator [uncultured bacterium (gcode 4)]